MRKEKIQCTKQDGVLCCVTLQRLFGSAGTSSIFAFYLSETIQFQHIYIYIAISTLKESYFIANSHSVFSQISFTEEFLCSSTVLIFVYLLFIYLCDSPLNNAEGSV